MKIKDSQELVIIYADKNYIKNVTAGDIRSWHRPELVADCCLTALSKLEELIDKGCYSTYIHMTNDYESGYGPDGTIACFILAMPEDPFLGAYLTEEKELEFS